MSKNFKYILDFVGNNRQLINSIGQNNKALNDMERNSQKSNSAVNSMFGGLKNIAGAMGMAFGAREVGALTIDMIKLSGEAEGVRTAFMKIADSSDLTRLRSSVHGTVSDLELMKRAVTAQNFGIPVKELGNLFAFATKRAQDTGQSVDYLVDSIVTGIGRKSPLILDNLGISATQLKEKLNGVAIESADVGQITKAVGEIAAESFKKTGDILDTNAIKVQAVSASWENLKLAVSGVFEKSSFIAEALDGATASINLFADKNVSAWNKLMILMGNYGAVVDAAAQSANALPVINPESEGGPLGKATVVTKQYANTITGLNERLEDYKKQLLEIAPNDRGALMAKLAQINAIEEQIGKIDKLKAAMKTMAEDTSSGFRKDRFQTITTINKSQVAGTDKAFDTKAKLDITAMQENMPVYIAAQEEMRSQMAATEEMALTVGATIGDSFTQFGKRAIESFGLASTGMEGFVGNMLSGITELMGMLLANAVGNAIVSGSLSASFTGPGAVFSLPAFIAAGVASVMGAFAAIPAFADGGVVYGPTMGLIGEYPGAASNPEVIAPLSKLQALIAPSGASTIILQPGIDFSGDRMRVFLKRVDNKTTKRTGK